MDNGAVVTYLPRTIDAASARTNAQNFRTSILPDQPSRHSMLLANGTTHSISAVPNLDGLLAHILQRWLQHSDANVVVFEEPLGDSDNAKFTRGIITHYAVYGKEIYYALIHETCDYTIIANVINESMALYRLGILSARPVGSELPCSSGYIDPALLQGLAERTRHIIVGAYDAEGFVVWSASGLTEDVVNPLIA